MQPSADRDEIGVPRPERCDADCDSKKRCEYVRIGLLFYLIVVTAVDVTVVLAWVGIVRTTAPVCGVPPFTATDETPEVPNWAYAVPFTEIHSPSPAKQYAVCPVAGAGQFVCSTADGIVKYEGVASGFCAALVGNMEMSAAPINTKQRAKSNLLDVFIASTPQ